MCFEWCRHQIIYWIILGIKKKKVRTHVYNIIGWLSMTSGSWRWGNNKLSIWLNTRVTLYLCRKLQIRFSLFTLTSSLQKQKKNTHFDVKSDSQIIIINIYWTLCLSSYLRTYLSLTGIPRKQKKEKKRKKELRLISTMAKGYIRMKTDQDLFNSDVKDLANSVKKLATHVIKLGSLGFFSTFLEWLAACAAM